MKNKDLHEWLLDNCIDSMLTIKDTKGAEIYLTDLLTKHLTEQLQQHSVSGKQPDYKTIHAAAVEYAQNEWKDAEDVHTEKKYSSNDFHAGALWALSQVAGVCSGSDKTT
jgi:hypothetical protein